MTRATYRFREHTLRPDPAERTQFAMECKICGQSSEGSVKVEESADWAADHLKENPGHLRFRERITRSYRFEPGEWL